MNERQYFIIQYGNLNESYSEIIYSATPKSIKKFNTDLSSSIVEFVEEFLVEAHESDTISDFFLIEGSLHKLTTKGYEQIKPVLVFTITDSRFAGNIEDGYYITLDYHLNATNNHIIQVQYFNNIAYDEIDMQLYDSSETAFQEVINITKDEVENLNGILQDIPSDNIIFNSSVKDAINGKLVSEGLNMVDYHDLFIHCQHNKLSNYFKDIIGKETYEILSKKVFNNRVDKNYIDEEASDDEIPF
ncbi:MAG: hypothetical protein MH472_10570 [Bacteroidia bacterium]|nr:hypothetical protein [Bacteroidia bacterium]